MMLRKTISTCDGPNWNVRTYLRRISARVVSMAGAVFILLQGMLLAEPATPSFDRLANIFQTETRPLLQQFCLKCHSTVEQQGDLDLERFATLADVRRGTKAWLKVVEMLDNGEMPPAESKQPTPKQRKQLRAWVEQYLHAESQANAGDPGPVVVRRLNNAEYNYTVQDLTGVELQPAQEFPTDSAAGEGFTNVGNALSMSPALFSKYLDAAKQIAQHAVLTPSGFRFSSSITARDWTNETVRRIREFYDQHVVTVELGKGDSVGVLNLHGDCRLGQLGKLPLEEYFLATLEERSALSTGQRTVAEVAAQRKLNARYLGLLWDELHAPEPSALLDDLRRRWLVSKPVDASAMAAEVAAWQRGLWTFHVVGLMGRKGSGSRWLEPAVPIVAEHKLEVPIPTQKEGEEPKQVVISLVVGDCGDGNEQDWVIWQQPRLVADQQPDLLLCDIPELKGLDAYPFGKHPAGRPLDAASLCVQAPAVIVLSLPGRVAAGRTLVTSAVLDPAAEGEASVQPHLRLGAAEVGTGLMPATTNVTFSQVTALYPEHRVVSYQKPILAREASPARKRFESAMEAHRRLFPMSLCYPQIVPADEVLTLTQFHREDEPLMRLLLDEDQRRTLDSLWSELRFVSQDPLKLAAVLDSLVETTKGHPQDGAFNDAVKPFHERAERFRGELRDAEPRHLNALLEFAAKAYRRPLIEAETAELQTLYHRLRSKEMSHDDAIRLLLARVFVAAPFLYRLETVPDGDRSAPVSDWELASRLSYFLWSSLPDDELRMAAASGTLRHPEELQRQTLRMLKQPQIRRLATEFGCQWLHVYDFPATETKNETLFPEFAALRQDLYEEPIRFLTDIIQRDGSLLELLHADHTFANERLARFYGFSGVVGDTWQRVEGTRQSGRGGILGFAAILAKQSGASRTSPILRGNWISETLLGEKLPRPPKDVPQLVEAVPEGLTERQLIERHSSDAACAKCHQRIDPLGFALEGFDAIGRRRTTTPAGVPIDTRTQLADGRDIEGLPGLRDFLLEHRRDDVTRQFCRKLLGYALGRGTQLSDQPLLDELQRHLAENDYRFSSVVLAIIQSRQFREIRTGDEQLAESP